jgi:hypothetical protein
VGHGLTNDWRFTRLEAALSLQSRQSMTSSPCRPLILGLLTIHHQNHIRRLAHAFHVSEGSDDSVHMRLTGVAVLVTEFQHEMDQVGLLLFEVAVAIPFELRIS